MLNLGEYRAKPRLLADYLPWACLVAPGVVLNKDGSFQRTAGFRGPDLESATAGELVGACRRLNNALKRFGSGWALFFEADRQPALTYPRSDFPDPASWIVDQERRANFEAEGAHFENAYYATLVWMPPAETAGRAERLFLDAPEGRRKFDYRDHLKAFIAQTDRAIDLMKDVFAQARALGDDETLTYLHGTVSTRRHDLRTPDIPAYLDAILVDEAVTGGLEPMLGEAHLRTLTVLGFPDATSPGLIDDLNYLDFPYRWSTRFIALDKTEAGAVLRRYRRQWFAKRKSIAAIVKEVMTNEQSALVDTDADNKAADADEALQELGADIAAYGYATTSVTVWDRDPGMVEEKARAVERVLSGRGFSVIRETVNAVDAWLGSLPGHLYANVRQPPINTINLAHMIPFSAVWAGDVTNAHLDGPPLLYAKTHGSTPFRLTTHVGDVGHSLVVGPTGGGKSVLLALLALQFRRYKDAQIYVFDKGASARAAVLAMGGDFYDLGGEDGLAFQPLAAIETDHDKAFALEWLCGLIAHESVDITPEVKEALWSALVALSAAPKPERTLTGLSVLLQSNALKQALHPYTLEGPFGRLLDADADRLETGSVQCFETEDLRQEASAVFPVLTYLFHRLEERFDGRPSLLILDEAWAFLDNPLFARRIREWLKTLRKRNVSVVFATQSLSDISGSAVASALIESCPSRIFLPNAHAHEPQERKIYGDFGLNDRQISIIAGATPKRDYYFQSSRGNRLFELGLGPIALAFCAASSEEDKARIADVLERHGSGTFAARYLAACGLDWAAELIDNDPRFGEGGAS